MRFRYKYRTSNNEVREGVLNAPSREDVYVELRGLGIRPFYVEIASGIYNRLLSIRGKVLMALLIGVLSLSLLFVVIYRNRYAQTDAALRQTRKELRDFLPESFESNVRRQIFGDSSLVEFGVRTAWRDVFSNPGDQYLAAYIVPGVKAYPPAATDDEVLSASLTDVVIDGGDALEVRQAKSILQGIKEELRLFVSEGGSVREYKQRLALRQRQECDYYRRGIRELSSLKESGVATDELMRQWEKRNAALKSMGIASLPVP